MPRWHLLILSLFLVIVTSAAKNTLKPNESLNSNSSESQSYSASDSNASTCYLPNCRKCDILDLESCTCTPVFVKCAKGFIFDEETCNCVESSSEPSLCPGLECPKGQHINEARCECTDKICQTFAPCPSNTILDLETCECICNLDPNICPDYYIFDDFNCLCRHPICDPPGPCPGSSVWDAELCQCKCTQRSCKEDFVFDAAACDCVSIHSTEPSTTEPETSSTHFNCDPPGPCPGLSSWNSTTCSCVCAVKAKCLAGYKFNIVTCQCENPFESSSSDSNTELQPQSSETSVNSSSSCYIPDCRWCDYLNEEECICYRMALHCAEGYKPDNEGCRCIPDPSPPISSCSIPDCRSCDYLDTENCECYRVVVDCIYGYQNTEDGCSCEPIPGFSFPSETYPFISCEPPEPCQENKFWNSDSCECQCIENVMCIANYQFDSHLCKCVPIDEISSDTLPSPTPSCDIVTCGSCEYLDTERCECVQYVTSCEYGYQVSKEGCSCEPIPGFNFSSSSSTSETDSSQPQPTFPCIPSSPCPDKHFWNKETCSCECVEQIECDSKYELSLRSCKCEPINGTDKPSDSYDSSAISESSSSECFIPDCRWCDNLDYENCVCHRIEFTCDEGFRKSKDGCSCFSISNGNLTLPPSVPTSSPCFIESCRWCDILDLEKCTCQKAFVDCAVGFKLSSDGCSCIKSEDSSSSSVTSSSNDPSSSSTFLNSSASCSLPYCRSCDVLDTENCICHKVVVDCAVGYKLSDDGCSCEWIGFPSSSDSSLESVSPTFGPCGSSPPPYCRWCDYYDAENCICHYRYVDCYWGYELSPDACTCIESNATSENCPGVYCYEGTIIDKNTCECLYDASSSISSSRSSSSSSSTSETRSLSSTSDFASTSSSVSCSLSFCRSCDILDTENCVCHTTVVDCFPGYELSEDGCECVKSNSTSVNCPGFFCFKGTFIDENTCQCINETCRSAYPCDNNLIMDAQSCECFCPLNPEDCSFPYSFDYTNCKCRHPPCLPPGPCPNKLSWDPEDCKCRCIQNEVCDNNFIFDSDSCGCVCDPKMMNTTCPSGSVFDSLLCDCVEEIECYDFNDPACACECEEIYDCPSGMEFDLDYCECMCPYYEDDPCSDGFVMNEETCECVKDAYHP